MGARTALALGTAALLIVASPLDGYDTLNCPVQALSCDINTTATLGSADCKNKFGAPLHFFSFVGTAGRVVSLSLNIAPLTSPLLSLYGPGDTMPAASASLFDNLDLSAAAIPFYQLTRDGTWIVVVTAIDPNVILSAHSFTITMICRPCLNPPAVIQQPSSATIAPGQTVTLSVTFRGIDQPTALQWFEGDYYSEVNPVAGATSATLTTRPIFVSTVFWLKATNDCGRTVSNKAFLTAVSPPRRRAAHH